MPLVPRRSLIADRLDGEIREVFLSATVKDARHYRNEVQEAVRQIEIAVFLQEEWNVGASLAIERGDFRASAMGGFLQIVLNRLQSWNVRKLLLTGQKYPDPPIFIFLPNPGSVAAKTGEVCRRGAYSDYPEEAANPVSQKTGASTARNAKKLFAIDCEIATFIRGFGRWGSCVSARSPPSQTGIHPAAKCEQGRHEALSAIPPNERGAIDRNAQRKVLERALAALYGSISPAMAVVVHGDEDMGHTDFLAWLGSWADWETDSGVIWITPPHDRIDISDLI